MNAHAERVTRTVQEKFLNDHEDLLWEDEANPAALNRKLAEWLLWYNGERPHEALCQRASIALLARERSMPDHLPRPVAAPSRRTGDTPLPTARPVGFYRQ